MHTLEPPTATKTARPWLRVVAGVILLPAFWISVIFAAVAILPAAVFSRFHQPLQWAALLPAGVLAWLAVRRAPALLLALLIPVLLVLYVVALNLMAFLPGQPG
jgi:hypothetical protein